MMRFSDKLGVGGRKQNTKQPDRRKASAPAKSIFQAPPRSGEKPGAAAIATIMKERTRASSFPEKRSRAIARERTEAAQTPMA